MIQVTIPGREPLQIEHVVMDVNGTIALDGRLIDGLAGQIAQLQEYVEVHLVTADTYGRQAEIDAALGLEATIVQHGATEKGAYILSLGADHVAVIGNGLNDVAMFNTAALRIAVLGPEGMAAALLTAADVLVRDISEGLDLLLNPDRLVATLRR
jgi:soluble P-type ATPase